jgi:hypothetical protein
MSKGRFKWLLVLAAILTLLVAGRLYRLHVRREWLKPVTVERGDTLVDITLPIISRSCDNYGGCVVETDGLYRGQPTGLTVIFAPGMRQSTFTDRVETTQVFPKNAGITLVVEGPRGTSLVHLLAASYGVTTHHVSLPVTIPMTAIAFEGNPADIQTQPLKFKVVHPSAKESPEYFELFIDTDLANNKVQLSEKETDYRPAILKAFGVQ